MGFRSKPTYFAKRHPNGLTYVSDSPAEAGEQAVGEIEAGSPLAAHRLLFGTLPDLDPGIADLVLLLNEIPGVMTWNSCEGHIREGDGCASVSIAFENLSTIDEFSELVSFITSDDAYMDLENPPMLGLCLELDLGMRHEKGGPIYSQLLLGRFPMDRAQRGRPPGAKALRAFALQLRERAAARYPEAVTAPAPPHQVFLRPQLREASR